MTRFLDLGEAMSQGLSVFTDAVPADVPVVGRGRRESGAVPSTPRRTRTRRVGGMTTELTAQAGRPRPSMMGLSALDDTDRQLVEALREDGRMSLATLGARVGLSSDAVRERLRHMEDRGLLQVTCSVDPRVLGFHTLALIGVTVTGAAEPIAEELARVSEFDLVGCITGHFDLIIEAVCRDEAHLLSAVDEHLRGGPDVAALTVLSYLQVLKFAPGGTAQPPAPAGGPPVELTQADLDIIAVLQADGRASFQDIADRIGLPYQMARRRTKALLESDVVRVETLVNRLAERDAVVASVGVSTSGPLSAITPAIIALDEVELAVVTAGPYDLHMEVVCRDRHHLAQVVGEKLRSIPGVVSTDTSVYQRLVKLPQSWLGMVQEE